MRVQEVERFPGYKVSDAGTVYGLKGQPLNPNIDSHGYQRVYPRGCKYIRVHRLVAEVFLPKVDGKMEINHIDGNKTNNRADNLEWTTHLENMRHAYAAGLTPKLGKGEDGLRAILTRDQVEFIRAKCRRRHPELSMSALARRFGVSVSCVHLAYHGRNWS